MSWAAGAALLGVSLSFLASGCATIDPPLADAAPGQRAWAASCSDGDDWDKPGLPFRLYGGTYYVGTCGITALLVDGPGGLTLLHTGTHQGAETVLANIREAGFEWREVGTILTSHEHFDHVGGIARVQSATGATVVTSPAAAEVLRTGQPGLDDPQAASGHPPFPAATGRIEELGDDRPRMLGGTRFTPVFTPGHTPGALSWQWRACERGSCKTIVYVDSLNPISAPSYRFSDHPDLVAAMRAGIARVAAMDCDILIAPHPSASALRARLSGERPLIDRGGCRAYAAVATERLDKRLAQETTGD